MMVALGAGLGLAAGLFVLAMVGLVINRENLIGILICLELMLLAVNTNFLTFAKQFHDVAGELTVFFVLAVAAAEAAIALAILVLLYRQRHSIAADDYCQLTDEVAE